MLISFKNKANGGGGSCDLQELEAVKNGTYTPEGFDGYSTVNVALPLEEVAVDINENGTLNVVPNTGKEGMTKVCINTNVVPTLVDLNETITTNGPQTYLPDPGVDGYGSVQIDVNVPAPKLEEVSKTIAINGNETITPSAGFDGISKVSLNVNVPGGAGKWKVPDGMKFTGSAISTLPDDMDFSQTVNFDYIFSDCSQLTTIPLINTSSGSSFSYTFKNCYVLTNIPLIDTSSSLDCSGIFYDCDKLKSIPKLDFSKARNLEAAFSMSGIESIPDLNTSSAQSMLSMCDACLELKSIGELNCSNVTNIAYFFGYVTMNKLTNLGGFKDLKIDWTGIGSLSACPNLTKQSILNILNGLYDFRGNGDAETTRTISFSKDCAAFTGLTEEEKAIATNKGWILKTE